MIGQITKNLIPVLYFLVCGGLIHFALNRILSLFYINIIQKTKTTFDDTFFPLIRRILGMIIWLVVGITCLNSFGVDVQGYVAGLGLSSIIMSILIKDSINNILSGFSIMFDTAFRVGDHIKLPTGEKCEVLHIGLKRSKFKVDDGILLVPNTQLNKIKFINYSLEQ